MTLRPWSLATLLLVCGCATAKAPRLDETAVLRLPADEQETLRAQRAQLEDADQRVTIAAGARDAARDFVKAVSVQAERRASALPSTVGDIGTRAHALEASDKLEYARRLLAAREAELTEARARKELANATLRRAEAQALTRHGTRGLDDHAFAAAETRAARRVEESARLASLRAAEASEMRVAWLKRHDVAQTLAPNPPPLPPQIPPPVNEGPNVPQSVPESNFTR